MGRDCASAGLPPRSDARSGLSVTHAARSPSTTAAHEFDNTAFVGALASPDLDWLRTCMSTLCGVTHR